MTFVSNQTMSIAMLKKIIDALLFCKLSDFPEEIPLKGSAPLTLYGGAVAIIYAANEVT